METKIRQYEDRDRAVITQYMEALQDHEKGLDPIHRIIRKEGYGEVYMGCLLEMIQKESGVMYVAEVGGEVIGMIAGILKQIEKQYVLGTDTDGPYGYVVDIFVAPEQRNHGAGALLMKQMEEYFRNNGCDVSTVEVLAHNTQAYDFYKRVGYFDRYVRFMKKL